ncbi:uncharacterized protein LOC129757675 [Uranotaenia lowii]|uniref:uncharacterized protein LOC129757675 n=1 Tax=Uranotaenia lowii TaxID=190385 RepID=UPI00247A992F|nr:uncharacterized protein LOC129757675 [Uranotaenia lowii]
MGISESEVCQILEDCGYNRNNRVGVVVRHINKNISSRNEAAMLLAHIIHETGGFQHLEELGHGSGHDYGDRYYGRGFIQLTWEGNYAAASMAIFGDRNVLLNDPDLVARDEDVAMQTAIWFWMENVRPAAGGFTSFYRTTKAINGALEGPNHPTARKRYEYYVKAANVLGVSPLADE